MSYNISLLNVLWSLGRPISACQRTIGPALHQRIQSIIRCTENKETHYGTGGTGVFIGSIRPRRRYPSRFTLSADSVLGSLLTVGGMLGEWKLDLAYPAR
jgi:hypothetical protein